MGFTESSTGDFDFFARVSQLIKRITSLLGDVQRSARLVEPINALADLRDALYAGSVPPDEVTALVERLKILRAAGQPNEEVVISNEVLAQLAAEARALLRKPGDLAGVPLVPSPYEVARAIDDFVEQLLPPFKRTRAALAALLQETEDVLNAVPVVPAVMLKLRSEIERLSIVRAFRNGEDLWMQLAEQELPLLRSRLESMLRPPASPSHGQRVRKVAAQLTDHSRRLRELKRLVRQIAAEERAKKARGDLHWRICRRLHNHPRPPGAKWQALSWPEAYRRYPSAVRAWISKAIHETD